MAFSASITLLAALLGQAARWILAAPLFFWCCCREPTGGVTLRRYGTSAPPDFEQKWDAGTNCTPFAVDDAGNVYTFSSTGPGSPNGSTAPSALTKWNSGGVLQWALPVTGTAGGVCVSPDGSKVVFTGNFLQASVTTSPLAPVATGFQTGSGGEVTLNDASDTLVQTTDYLALQFGSPLPPYAILNVGTLSVHCPIANESTVNASAYMEVVANAMPLAAVANNISARSTSGGATPVVWSSGGSSLGLGWHSIQDQASLGSITQLPDYAEGNLCTVIIQGRAGLLCDFNIDLADSPPQLVLTYTPPALSALCLNTDDGSTVWTAAAQPLGSPFLVLGKSLFSVDGTGIFAALPASSFNGVNEGIARLDASTGRLLWQSILQSEFVTMGDFTVAPSGLLYAATFATSINGIADLNTVDPTSGATALIGGSVSGYPRECLVIYNDGSFGGTDGVGNFFRFEAPAPGSEGAPLSMQWSFGRGESNGYVGASTDGTHTFLVNGGQLLRVNADGTVDYNYTIPLVPPLLASGSVQPAARVALDSEQNVYLGGTYVAFEPPG